VQSLHPYCTDASKVEAPEDLLGFWQPVVLPDTGDDEDALDVKPWRFSKDKVLTHDEENVPSHLDVVFFRLDGVLYADFTAGDPAKEDKAPNGYWVSNVMPMHTLGKVVLAGDRLEFRFMDYGWLTKAVEARDVMLPVIERKDEVTLFTATPEEWEAFLKVHGKDPGLFVSDKMVFRRAHGPEAERQE
jgi:hypothetical protein